MHGINSNASSLDYLQKLIQEHYPTRFVLNVEVGNGRETSIFSPMFEQVELFNQQIQSHPELADGFHLIGFSQGTLITRGYIQLYNKPPVINYISLAGPQAGQFGTPYLNIEVLDNLLSEIDYITPIQNYLAPGQYWKNPKLLDLYVEKSIYLAVINNERNYNQTLYNNFVSINKLILVYSTNDKVIHPPISGWFGFYDSQMNILQFNQTDIYLKDLFGLKKLNIDNKIEFYKTEFEHTDHTNELASKFINETIIPWLA
jgi:palmitoyl-protein thioesterase